MAGLLVAAWVAVVVFRRWMKVSEIWSEMLTRGAIRITEYAYFKIALCSMMELKLPF